MQRLDGFLWLVCAAGTSVVLSSCNTPGAPRGPRFGGSESSSEVTSISIGLPSRDGLKDQVADIETKMNGYHLVIKPVDSSCAGATKVDEVGEYAGNAKLNASLQQGCDYDVTLSLGNKASANGGNNPTDPNAARKVSYDGEVKSIIDRACVSCHGASSSYGDLSSYQGAKAKADRVIARGVTNASMPPSGPLARSDRDVLQAWASDGYLEKAEATDPNDVDAATSLTATYYKNETAKRIAKSDIEGQSAFKASLSLQLQADGRAIGLSDVGSVEPGQPDEPEQPGTTVNLPQDRNLSLTTASGGTETLASVFKGSYLVVDVSQETCGYCVTAANQLNSSASEQKMFDGTKCSHATLVPQSQLGGWLGRIGGQNGFAGKHSYGMQVGFGALASAFGINFQGTPAYMMLDAQGKVIAYEEGGMPAEVQQLCQ